MSTELVLQGTPTPSDGSADKIQRQSVNFDPSVWGDFFITYSCDNRAIQVWRKEAEILETKAKELLTDDFTAKQLGQKLSMVDAIQRLGIGYHFEKQIEAILQQSLKVFLVDDQEDHELLTVALLFRLLRQQGHNFSRDVFNKFTDSKDSFKEVLAEDIEGMLSLYEATFLRLHGETILDEALTFTRTTLESKLPHLQPYLSEHVLRALWRPVRKAIPRLAAREYISFYQQNEHHNEVLLKLAKLDFNLLQKEHLEELRILSKWWKNLEVKTNWPYARDRLTECYFWILGVYFEPQYALARKFLTKVIAIASVLDDTYDAYGTYAELELFTNALQRWDIRATDELPNYMKFLYATVLEIYSEMEEEVATEGRSYAICYAKEGMKMLARAYLAESKWLLEKKTPTIEEYMHIAAASSGYSMLAVASLAGMGEVATKEAFDFLMANPPILQATCRLTRLMDDTVSHKLERTRDHIPSAVECYMNEHKVSADEAYVEFNDQIENAWMDINQAFLDPQAPSVVLMRVLNLARVMDLLYKGEDIYTHCAKMKPYIASLLINELQI